ncbi:hypothetical protein QAD02_000629 [Eretmocerus hayati]|uniref:Uncharacterized protein n=1 Tax=Eretmocerus hayati TaxID=131215 RepID=A0ACC2NDW2_9HYME|nr:hypothetical protein QAD02_000629 [Eretmocerus hayati]
MATIPYQFIMQFAVMLCLWGSCKAEPIFGKDVYPVDHFNEYPHIVMVTDATRIKRCTGVVVSPRHVLTAAQCLPKGWDIQQSWDLVNELAASMHIVTPPSARSASSRSFKAKSMFTYSRWARIRELPLTERLCNDIAVIEVHATDMGIAPVTMAYTEDTQSPGLEVVMTGWGATRGNISPNVVHKAKVTILSKSICESMVNGQQPQGESLIPFHLEEEFLCLAGQPNSAVASVGDFGGPVFDQYGRLVGILSKRCPQVKHNWLNSSPVNLALRVSRYREFIQDAIVENEISRF